MSSTFFLGCKTDSVDGIILEYTLVSHQEYSVNKQIVSLIKLSLKKDSEAFNKLIHFPNIDGEGSYDLGYIITQIIYRIGEIETIKMLNDFDKRELNNLRGMIRVGLEYGDNNYDGKMDETYVKDEFPKLFKYINEKLNN
ncbi:hypothetical protein [uncultured Winogradskyella sp.]|uniref:hypothetical protein n=1 Tax=uncultured Winogradskyella sp. TaxID=395353 RepID=UPI002625A872|nr:hypothetical protein [uncultured Winogradskyella sp.]